MEVQWDWNISRPLAYMDIETQSPVDLRKEGSTVYLSDPHTRLASAVFLIDDVFHVWIPPGRSPEHYTPVDTINVKYHFDADIPEVIRSSEQTHTWVAHNAESFDARAWQIFFPHSQPRWIDTLHLCRYYGYPGTLDAASKAMGGRGKADTRAMHLITEARSIQGRIRYNVTTAELWEQFIAYNIQDVEELKYICDHVCTKPEELEHEVLKVSGDINARGVRIDVNYARALRDTWLLLRNDAADNISEMTKGALNRDNIKSPKAVKTYLKSLGFHTDSIANAYVNQIIKDPETFLHECGDDEAGRIVAVLALRQDAVRATAGKIDRVFKVLHRDDCVRFMLQYYGAQTTGRYSGRDLQPHNFARGYELGEDGEMLLDTSNMNLDNIIEVSKRHRHPQLARHLQPAEVLSTFSRSMIRPRNGKLFAPIDYMGIEARFVAWLADCSRALEIFADPKRDIYCDMASALFGKTVTKHDKALRQVGKIIVLGCGYGMAARTFLASANNLLVDLTAVGVTAEQCVKTYRSTYHEIQHLWREYDKACHYAVKNHGQSIYAGKCTFKMIGSFLTILLPSGRMLRYRNARLVFEAPKWDLQGSPVWQVVYDGPYGYRKSLYGGLIAENVTQAISRDILAGALVNTAREGFISVLHVHDEGCFELDNEDQLDTVASIMVRRPYWCGNAPMGVEGFTHPIAYTKEPGKNSKKVRMFAS